MTAVDTNVLVRLLAGDDPKQEATAEALLASGPVWIAKTVLLETEWVLRSMYGFDHGRVCEVFTRLLRFENVHVEEEPSVTAAVAMSLQGIDFADAMHLSSRPPGTAFVTFDRAFERRAERAGVTEVFLLQA